MPQQRPRASGKRRKQRGTGPQSTPRKPATTEQSATTRAAVRPGTSGRVAKKPVPGKSRAARPAAAARAKLPPAARTIVWQVYGCAALCAFGAATGLLRVIGEGLYHFSSARHTIGWLGAAVAVGVVLGSWLPRRVIDRRLGAPVRAARGSGPSTRKGAARRSAKPAGIEFEFAATLTGAVILALALLWVLLSGLAASMETYRALLAQRFMHPQWLTRVLLCGPASLGLFLLGALGTTVLVALHGWHRLVTQPRTHGTRLWVTILTAGALGAGFAALVQRADHLDLATLLATFAAAILAVFRKPVGAVRPDMPPHVQTHSHAVTRRLLLTGVASMATAVAVWLAVALLEAEGQGWPTSAANSPPPAAGHGAAARAARELFEAPGVRTAYVYAERPGPKGGPPSAWELDLRGPAWDVIVLAASPGAPPVVPLDTDRARRLLRRCAVALLDGGRLVIELPAEHLAEAAVQPRGAAEAESTPRAYLLRVAGHGERYEALIVGRDVPAWLGQRPELPGFDVLLYPVRRAGDLERLVRLNEPRG